MVKDIFVFSITNKSGQQMLRTEFLAEKKNFKEFVNGLADVLDKQIIVTNYNKLIHEDVEEEK